MTSKKENATKSVRFRDGEDEFKVLLEVTLENGKVVSVSDSTIKFFDFLKNLDIISNSEDIYSLLNSSQDFCLSLFSNLKHYSFQIRKKASLLGLSIILGPSFQERKSESLKKATSKSCCIQHIATN